MDRERDNVREKEKKRAVGSEPLFHRREIACLAAALGPQACLT